MSAFEYSALTSSGSLKNGVLESETPRQARQILRDQGLTPVSIQEISKKDSSKKGSNFFQKFSSTDLAILTRQLATLVRSGTVLDEALKAIAEQSDNKRVSRVISSVRVTLLEGHSLATAFSGFPSYFPELYCATVEAGEQSGHLDLVLERLADYTEFRQQIRQKVLLALLYPALLSGISFFIVTALLAYVVPQVITVFNNVGQDLPLMTKALIALSGFLKEYGIIICFVALCLAAGFKMALRDKSFQFFFHRVLLKVPLLSRIIKTFNSASFSRSFSILISSGISAVEGMQFSAKVLHSLPIRSSVEQAALRVREGESLHGSLHKTGYFPPITLHLIASGEATARLDEMLDKAAHTQEREIESLLTALLSIFEPLLILVMGGIILCIVLAILLPILDLNQMVR